MKIEYRNFRSPSQEQEFKNILEQLSGLIPKKVLTLTVLNWDVKSDSEFGVTCSIDYNPCYLFSTLYVYDAFFSQPETERFETLIHELTHLQCTEFSRLVNEDLIPYVRESNEPLAEQFRRISERAEEAMVSQIARFIMESISGNKRN